MPIDNTRKCQHHGCTGSPLIDGWCKAHRWGTCEMCGAQGFSRVAIEHVEIIGDTRHTRLAGMPIMCESCANKHAAHNQAHSPQDWRSIIERENKALENERRNDQKATR